MKSIRRPGAVLALALALGAAPIALAPGAARAAPPAAAMRMPHASLPHINKRLAALKSQLAITPAQMPQWHVYAEAERSDAPMLDRLRQQLYEARVNHANAVQWYDLRQRMLTAESTHLAKVATAFAPLYATLDPAQRQIADHALGPHPRHRWHH